MYSLKILSVTTKTLFEVEVPSVYFVKHISNTKHDEGNCTCCAGDELLRFADSLSEAIVGNIREDSVIKVFKDQEVLYSGDVKPAGYYNEQFSIMETVYPALEAAKDNV